MFQQMRAQLILEVEVAPQVSELWFQGSKWLPHKDQWPVQQTIQTTYKTEQEAENHQGINEHHSPEK